MSRRFALPFTVSIAGHAGLLAALILLVGKVPLAPLPTPEPPGIEITLAPAEPIPPPPIPDLPPPPPPIPDLPPPPPPIPDLPPPPPPIPDLPPPPPPIPPPVVVAAPPPPPPPRPREVRRAVPRPAPRRPPPRPVQQEERAPAVPTAVPRPVAPPARPIISADYRAALSAWLQRHKQYPEGARARGEQGQVLLRFHVARSGQLINFAVVRSSGYADLDAAVDAMMRGAVLPAFPADMAATDIEVTVPVQFALTR